METLLQVQELAESGGIGYRSPVQIEEICTKTAELRAQRVPMCEIAMRLNIPLRSLERHFSTWCKTSVTQMKEQWEHRVQEFVETQELVITKALEARNFQLAHTANVALLEQLRKSGIVPTTEKNSNSANLGWLFSEEQREALERAQYGGT